jgi:polyphosphate kinase 2 (PPK2 family)
VSTHASLAAQRRRELVARPPTLSRIDLSSEVKDKETYDSELSKLQLLLLREQQRYFHNKKRAIIVLEGWDAAGKGGAIRRMTEKLDPRGLHVWPIGPPSAEDQGKHYLYRFWDRLPSPGTWALFDRSWYGRVLVERVEKLCPKEAWERAYDEINEFERMLVADGVPVIKLFFHISKKEQLKRFHEREANPYKRWKITPEDWRNRRHWNHYEKAIDRMFAETSTRHAPWNVVPGEHKWYARTCACTILSRALQKGFR